MAKKPKKAPLKISKKQILKMERAARRDAQLEAGIKIVPRVHKSKKSYSRKNQKPPENSDE